MDRNLSLAEIDICLKKLYGENTAVLEYQAARYKKLSDRFKKFFAEDKANFFSSPGRTELGGNHTDHNNGMVIAAAINYDSIACASKTQDNRVVIHSEGYVNSFIVDLNELNPLEKEAGSTSALIRGIAAGFSERGFKTGGFNACITSDVLPGSGLSSSASVEVLIGTIFNCFYNEGNIPPREVAKIGQYSENKFFGKPCGLMDQVACAVGGIVSIDFKENKHPVINRINFDFAEQKYSIIVVHTGSSHINLTDDYSSIPKEMKNAAQAFGKQTCRELELNDFLKNLRKIRSALSDREILRAYHFLKENERVQRQIDALTAKDFGKFLDLVNESGNSSFKWLQNIYSSQDVNYQPVSLALALSEDFIERTGYGACRIHGGGFAGTMLAFIPNSLVNDYKSFMSSAFDPEAIKILSIRNQGAFCFNH
ncbi:MAG TPA: galactokinase family protein [Ignavibacteriaceae bacterium]|nr:galactokinase family protein [Ignavibacteriaceae bacterium]